ncbi:MAG: DUF4982 domain-containing protein [Pontiellaceae bacterium]|nr:DUF4982 domain-containing protein [Pontiellaceae bacterium]
MKKRIVQTTVLIMMTGFAVAQDGMPGQRLRMDADWRFHLDDIPSSVPSGGVPVEHWCWQMSDANGSAIPGTDRQEIAVPAPDIFEGKAGFALFEAVLPPPPAVAGSNDMLILHFGGVDDNATVYLNGQKVFYHAGYAEPFDVPLDTLSWEPGETNRVTVLVENTGGGGGVGHEVMLLSVPRTSLAPEPAREGFDDGDWRTVQLPHDYIVEQTFSPKASPGQGSLPAPKAWYRRTFTVPENWRGKSVWIDFDGVFRDSKVWFNGVLVGGRKSGYIGFGIDLSDLIRYGGTNTIAVFVNPGAHEGWWYEGGGIYRHVWLNVADRIHFAPNGIFIKTRVDGLKNGAADLSVLNILANITNATDAVTSADVEVQVIAPNGDVVAGAAVKNQTLEKGKSTDIELKTSVEKPALWSIESPAMYTLVATIRVAGERIDSRRVPFGIRTVTFDPDAGFFLNGKPVKIKGTCNHQDFAGVGVALSDSMQEWRVRKLQEVGCNAWRTAHNPVSSELLDACDRLGMLVLNETRHFGDTDGMKTAVDTPTGDLSELSDMVYRDRNHPSIIAWSIANEENAVERTETGERIGRAMKAVVDSIDGTRPVTAAMTEHFAGYPGLSKTMDMEGLNYGPPQNYDRFHQEHPQTPVIATETTSALATRGEYDAVPFSIEKSDLIHLPRLYWGNKEKGYMNGLGLSPDRGHATSACWKPIAERPFVSGGFVWTGFDYRGEPHPFVWPVINSHFGFMDTCGFPKDDYYYYLAWWGNKPVVHLAPHWNWPEDKGVVKVLCHSNAERVELFLNGRSLGSKPMPRYEYLSWDVLYEPGRLEARGFNGDQHVAVDVVETTGPAASIRLVADRMNLIADCEDQLPVEVSILDAEGRVVPTAGHEIEFAVFGNGSVAGVGNGDPACHEPDKAGKRSAFNGHCMVIVQAGGKAGNITLTATAKGLSPATLVLETASPPTGHDL